ncbi:MAG TPA: histidine triad nucleotide-binding protein [Gemmatimonadaceae bacterium]|nr:histidine triad nucleotide-binding protein [Gemmatimonadaceae bacterium]
MSEHCLFCRIIKREVAAEIVAESDECLAFKDADPQAPVHVLVVPKQHVSSLNDVTDAATAGALALMAAEVARAAGIADSGYRTVINTNGNGGQSVFHLHLHVLGGRKLVWPPG